MIFTAIFPNAAADANAYFLAYLRVTCGLFSLIYVFRNFVLIKNRGIRCGILCGAFMAPKGVACAEK
jgi:hypothetical protein